MDEIDFRHIKWSRYWNLKKNNNFLTRTEALIGKESIEKLSKAKIALIGVGGVGGFAMEALVRSGIGKILMVDKDIVDVTNLNRQIIATIDTIDKVKVEVAKERALSINPNVDVEIIQCQVSADTIIDLNLSDYDYVIDAIDDIYAKVELVTHCKEHDICIISAMGAGKKLNPTMFKVADIYSTKVDPLARRMRTLLKQKNVKNLKVVYSEEKPIELNKSVVSSISFMPSVMGLIIASEVIKDLIKS